MDPDTFQREVGELTGFLRSRKPAAGVDAVRLPGEGARARAGTRRSEGIPVDDATCNALRKLADELGVPPLD
jgi:uncharacterized oxidoreductase